MTLCQLLQELALCLPLLLLQIGSCPISAHCAYLAILQPTQAPFAQSFCLKPLSFLSQTTPQSPVQWEWPLGLRSVRFSPQALAATVPLLVLFLSILGATIHRCPPLQCPNHAFCQQIHHIAPQNHWKYRAPSTPCQFELGFLVLCPTAKLFICFNVHQQCAEKHNSLVTSNSFHMQYACGLAQQEQAFASSHLALHDKLC